MEKYVFIAFIHLTISSGFSEKSAGSATLCSVVLVDIGFAGGMLGLIGGCVIGGGATARGMAGVTWTKGVGVHLEIGATSEFRDCPENLVWKTECEVKDCVSSGYDGVTVQSRIFSRLGSMSMLGEHQLEK